MAKNLNIQEAKALPLKRLAAAIALLPLVACNATGVSTFSEKLAANDPNQTYGSAYSQQQVKTSELRSATDSGDAEAQSNNNSDESNLTYASLSGDDTQSGSGQSAAEPTPEELAEQRISFLYPQIEHGKCKGGWGKQAKRLDGKRVNPDHLYYIEIRMRHTPPLPIGHTYSAYGRLGPNGEKLDEHLVMLAPVGGYAGAAVAAATPMPAITLPSPTDCNIEPVAAYRVSLTAQQYEKLLLEVKQAKLDEPKYHLFAYNCNHFTSRISEAVGIQTPRNKYTSSLVYMYDIIKEDQARHKFNNNQITQAD